ncbi:CHASE2 domain-containing protein [Luteimonas gilva]|uniref:diguanylate cyclase n=1 Tax=Luteimonas gilva TaxID=2572684 RepID=A0A4V5ZQH4_9GAMM|nr:CHASE2 domain-containing protein [Luteimonas gilva]TKR32773.1 CHASE2 domain-containing protein [Luteimonas gilva]
MRADGRGLRWKLLAGLAAAACTALLTVSGLTWRFDTWLYDFLIAHSGQQADPSIVLVEVDDDSLSSLGRWPWPRRIHADLLDKLHGAGARGIALDIAFAEPDRSDPAGDAKLAAAIKREGGIVLPVMVEPSQPDGTLIEVLPMPEFSAAAADLGHVEVDVDPDGVARHTYLRAGLGEARWPALALALFELRPSESHRGALPGLLNPQTTASPYLWVRDRDVMIPYVSDGKGFQRVSYLDLLRGQVPAELLRDRWLLVGVTAHGIGDTLLTPVASTDTRISGLEYQANLLNMLVRGNAITPLTASWQLAFGLALTLLPLLVLAWTDLRRPWLLALGACTAVVLFCALLLHVGRYWFAPMPALATLLLALAAWGVYRLQLSQRLAHSDALTRLSNRRLFDVMLTRELGAARRGNRPLSLLLIDLDHFKHYNDTQGHQAGDDALRRIAHAIAERARRPRDVPARYGGDELAAILPETTAHAAQAIADHIVRDVRALAIAHPGSDVAPVMTVSIGVATYFPILEGHEADLLERADAALYQAKQKGRDRSFCAETTTSA